MMHATMAKTSPAEPAAQPVPAPPAAVPTPTEPQQPPPDAPRPDWRSDLAQGLAEMAKELKLSGHALLGFLAGVQGAPAEMTSAAHDVAFAVNTGLAGHLAAEGLRKAGHEGLAKLLVEVVDGGLGQAEVTALLRERFPEPVKPRT